MSSRSRTHSRYWRRSLSGRLIPRKRPFPTLFTEEPPRKQPFSFVLRLVVALLALVLVVILSGVGVAFGAYQQLATSLKGRIETGMNGGNTFQTTTLYDRNGKVLYEFFGAGKRTRVTLNQISPLLVNATIAIEDKTFRQNQGIDIEGILKAFGRSLQAGEATGGASTITQQVVKNIVLTADERKPENVYRRKISEIVLAQELTQKYSKDEILDLYLNDIYYGNLAYGSEAASQTYFNKHANELTLAEAALLAGLPQLPNVYDPFQFLEGNRLSGIDVKDGWRDADYTLPENTPAPKWRQIAVLRQMVDEGYVTEAQARDAIEQDLIFNQQEAPLNAPHFVFYVRKLLEEKYGQNFANLGLKIYTTIDLDLQNMVQEQATERITELEERNIHNAAVVVMRPNTGEILSMVGSIDFNKSTPSTTPGETGNVLDGQVNVAVRERQPGSALKPFAYLAAMEKGATPETIFWDIPTEFGVGDDPYVPLNYNGRFNGPVRMRTALANSLNLPAVRALKFAGVSTMIDLLHKVGITGLQRGSDFYGLSLTLGGGEVTPLDLTTAYNTLASGGKYYPPVAILKIVDGNGTVLENFTPPSGTQVIDADQVSIISDMLSDDKAREPIWGLNSKLKLSRPAAVKTGTSNDWRDAWAVGYTPAVTVGVWTGNNNNEPTAKVESLTGGGVIWHNVMEGMFADSRFASLLKTFDGQDIPLLFIQSKDLTLKTICQMPGSFNNYQEDLFTPEMLKAQSSITSTLSTSTPTPFGREQSAEGSSRFVNGVYIAPHAAGEVGCSAYTKMNVVKLTASETITQTVVGADGETEVRQSTTSSPSSYCRLTDSSVDLPDDVKTTIYLWNLPPNTRDERVEYRWNNAGGSIDGSSIVIGSRGEIQDCTPTLLAQVAPPGATRMPDLQYLGENQAKELLKSLGITNEIYVDYQTRDRVPDVFDQYVPYAVISSMPSAGEWIYPGELIVLGIRSPDEGLGTPQPTAPADGQATPTADAGQPISTPDPGQAPPPEATPPAGSPEAPVLPPQVVPGIGLPTPPSEPSAP